MSVRPVNFLENGDIEVVFDEGGHSGTIPADQIQWATTMTGGTDHNFLILQCPDGCGATSTWPVSGGADAIMGQQMFIKKVQREGCACGKVSAEASNSLGESHVHLNVNKLDGPGRWAGGVPAA